MLRHCNPWKFGLPWLLAAASAAGQSAPQQLAPLEVTGTRLSRPETESVQPVTFLSRDLMDSRNALTPVELLTALPIVTTVQQNESAIGGTNGRGDNANVNLRGIGPGNTLVLLNGRRVAPHPTPISDPTLGALGFSANVNQLPVQAAGRIEVLRDGASSIYGSDAVAGVINLVARADFRGAELRTRFAVPEHPGGANLDTTLRHGAEFAGGHGRWQGTLDWFYRRPITMRERSFSRSADHTEQAPAAFNNAGSTFNGLSAVSVWPSFRIGTGTAANFFRPVNGAPVLTSVAPTRAANSEYYLDVNAWQDQGFTRSARVNCFEAVEYDLGAPVTMFGEIGVYLARTDLTRSPIPFNAPASEPFSTIAADNPFNPYGTRFFSPTGAPNPDGSPRVIGTPQSLMLISHAIVDNGGEAVRVDSGIYRGVVGVRGKLLSEWRWEAGGLYTRAYAGDKSTRGVRLALFQDALRRIDATAYNPFGYTFRVAGNAVVPDRPYTNPASVLDTFVRTWRRDGFSSIASVDAHATGPLFRFSGGTAALVAGGELRRETFADHRPEFAGLNPPGFAATGKDNDFLLASPKPDSSGARSVASAFAETRVPFVSPQQGLPLLRALALTSSLRVERYSGFGSQWRPKVALAWRPHDGVLLRASFNEGFSAPNLPTLRAPSQFSIDVAPGVTDPYRNPVTNEGPSVQRMFFTANPGLKPVTTIGRGAGVVLEPPAFHGLSLTVDYWQIDQENIVGSRTTAQILNRDAALLTAYTQAQLAAGRAIGQIDAGSGMPDYRGDPGVVRNPATSQDLATFAAYNAAHPAAPLAPVGTIASRRAAYENLAKGYANGFDLSLTGGTMARSWGRLEFFTEWAYRLRTYQLGSSGGAAPVFLERMNVDGITRWRGVGMITWRRENWSADISAYYTGSFADSGAVTTAANYDALGAPGHLSKQFDSGAYLYRYVAHDVTSVNLGAGYRFPVSAPRAVRGMSVRLGVVNATDRAPPLTSGAPGYSAAVHGALFPGRTFTLELTRSL